MILHRLKTNFIWCVSETIYSRLPSMALFSICFFSLFVCLPHFSPGFVHTRPEHVPTGLPYSIFNIKHCQNINNHHSFYFFINFQLLNANNVSRYYNLLPFLSKIGAISSFLILSQYLWSMCVKRDKQCVRLLLQVLD